MSTISELKAKLRSERDSHFRSLLNIRPKQIDPNDTFCFLTTTLRKLVNATNSFVMDETLLKFGCHLDRSVFKCAARKNCLFIRAGMHKHEEEDRFHAHCILRMPDGFDFPEFTQLVKKSWDNLDITGNVDLLGPSAFKEITATTEFGVIKYMLKDRYQLEGDAFANVFNGRRYMLEQKFGTL